MPAFSLPNLRNDINSAQDMKQLKNYLFMLVENLEYTLNNLDAENLTADYNASTSYAAVHDASVSAQQAAAQAQAVAADTPCRAARSFRRSMRLPRPAPSRAAKSSQRRRRERSRCWARIPPATSSPARSRSAAMRHPAIPSRSARYKEELWQPTRRSRKGARATA